MKPLQPAEYLAQWIHGVAELLDLQTAVPLGEGTTAPPTLYITQESTGHFSSSFGPPSQRPIKLAQVSRGGQFLGLMSTTWVICAIPSVGYGSTALVQEHSMGMGAQHGYGSTAWVWEHICVPPYVCPDMCSHSHHGNGSTIWVCEHNMGMGAQHGYFLAQHGYGSTTWVWEHNMVWEHNSFYNGIGAILNKLLIIVIIC